MPGRSEYGKTCRCDSGDDGRYVEVRGEVVVGLARKPDDHVGADRGVRQALGDARRPAGDSTSSVYGRRIAAEHPIARVLQRQMEVRREAAAAAGDQLDDLRRAVHRLERADPERHVGARDVEARAAASTSDAARLEVAPVRAQVHAGQRDLLEAGGRDPLDLADDVGRPAGCGRRRASSE